MPRVASPPTINRQPIVLPIVRLPVEQTANEDCCICLDEKVVPQNKMTKCKHPICGTCTNLIRDTTCHMCRAPLEGGYLTQNTAENIKNRKILDKKTKQLRINAYRYYVDTHKDTPSRERHDNAITLSDAYEIFINQYPDMSDGQSLMYFQLFMEFVGRRQITDPTINPYTLAQEFVAGGGRP